MNRIINIMDLMKIRSKLMMVAENINIITSPEYVTPERINSIERTRIRMMHKALIDTGLISESDNLSDTAIEHKFYSWVI